MDWKKESITNLKQYAMRKSSLERTAEEIRRLESDAARIRSATTDGTPVQGGISTREDALINNIALRQELEWAREGTLQWLNGMDDALNQLSTEDRLVLDRFYIHRATGNVERLCEELHVEKPTAYRRRDTALHRFTLIRYGATER